MPLIVSKINKPDPNKPAAEPKKAVVFSSIAELKEAGRKRQEPEKTIVAAEVIEQKVEPKKPIPSIKPEEKPYKPPVIHIDTVIEKLGVEPPKPPIDAEQAAKEAEVLRKEILELKKTRKELRQAKEEEREVGVALVVDGERKKVSKTSKYLLDMLTLDDQ